MGRLAIVKLFNTPPADVPLYDLAEMNLVCAFGLRGTADMDMGAMLRLLDEWARRIAAVTFKRARLLRTRASRVPVARFRITVMIEVEKFDAPRRAEMLAMNTRAGCLRQQDIARDDHLFTRRGPTP